jgi:hypothetical protein
MHEALKYLTASLDRDTRQSITARSESLMRGIRYEAEKQSRNYRAAADAGWSVDRVGVLCDLNAFYQVVLGPIAAASRSDLRVGLVRDTPIAYGKQVRVTGADADLLRECHNQFSAVIQRLGIDFWCLQSAHAQDLLYKLGHPRGNND